MITRQIQTRVIINSMILFRLQLDGNRMQKIEKN